MASEVSIEVVVNGKEEVAVEVYQFDEPFDVDTMLVAIGHVNNFKTR